MAKYPDEISADSDLLIAANRSSTTLATDLSIDATEIDVLSTETFPSVGAITIEDERIKYESKTATKFLSCVRGYDSSVQSSHLAGSAVKGNIIAAHHNLLKDEVVAIETELGTDPSGTYDTVAGRLDGIDTALDAKADVVHSHQESDITNLADDLAGKVPTSRQILTSAPLSGGGDLTADLTLSIPAATQAQDGYLKKEDWADFSNAVSWALEALTADRTYYVRTDGSDSNDGLENNAQHAWKTIQHAVRWVAGHLNLNGYTCYIQVADGNYDETNGVRLLSDPVGPGFVYVQGNSGNYNAVVVDASSQGTGTVYARGSIKYVFRWMKVQNTAASGDRAAFYADTLSMITVKDLNVGTVGNAAFLGSDSGKVLVQGSIGCAGNAAALIYAKFHGIVVVSGATITLSGNPSYSVATVYALAVSFVGFFSTTWSGSATGKRYSGDTLSLIETLGMGATWIPGSVAGTVTNGAVYH